MDRQELVLAKAGILRHCGLWEEVHSDDRGPPDSTHRRWQASSIKETPNDWSYEPDPEATAFADP